MVEFVKPYPWQQSLWAQLNKRRQNDRLPHGLLFEGPQGVGKAQFAEALIQSLLCHQPDAHNMACGKCESCLLLKAGSHPDYKRIEPADTGKAIAVDQIREVIHYLSLKPHFLKQKIVVIHQADAMNVNSANSLLKSLEEPPPSALMMLVTSKPAALLPTIRSRCQTITFAVPETDVARSWLKINLPGDEDAGLLLSLAQGAPLKALAYAESDMLGHRQALLKDLDDLLHPRADLVGIGKSWLKLGLPETLYWLSSWVMDLLRIKVAARPPMLNNLDQQPRLREFAERFDESGLIEFEKRIVESHQRLRGNANPALVVEDLLLAWRELQTHTNKGH